MPNLGLQLSRTSNFFTGSGPFAPTDLPDLELWLDANENVLSFVGNKFTDVTASVDVNAGVGDVSTGTYENDGSGNYNFLIGTDRTIKKESGVWVLGNNHPDDGFIVEYTSTGNVTYPWQATWPTITVTRTATTNDIQAANDEAVVQWNNKISAKPHLIQSTLNSRPTFKTDVFGRKAVYFSSDALHNSGFSVFEQYFSFYFVSTSLITASSVTTPAVRLGTGGAPSNWRALFGATSTSVSFQNGTISRPANLSPIVTDNFGVFSAQSRIDGDIEGIRLSRNLSNTLTEAGDGGSSGFANSDTIIVGAGNQSGSTRAITSNFSEMLVYKAYHNEATATQVINYLVNKWNINTNL